MVSPSKKKAKFGSQVLGNRVYAEDKIDPEISKSMQPQKKKGAKSPKAKNFRT